MEQNLQTLLGAENERIKKNLLYLIENIPKFPSNQQWAAFCKLLGEIGYNLALCYRIIRILTQNPIKIFNQGQILNAFRIGIALAKARIFSVDFLTRFKSLSPKEHRQMIASFYNALDFTVLPFHSWDVCKASLEEKFFLILLWSEEKESVDKTLREDLLMQLIDPNKLDSPLLKKAAIYTLCAWQNETALQAFHSFVLQQNSKANFVLMYELRALVQFYLFHERPSPTFTEELMIIFTDLLQKPTNEYLSDTLMILKEFPLQADFPHMQTVKGLLLKKLQENGHFSKRSIFENSMKKFIRRTVIELLTNQPAFGFIPEILPFQFDYDPYIQDTINTYICVNWVQIAQYTETLLNRLSSKIHHTVYQTFEECINQGRMLGEHFEALVRSPHITIRNAAALVLGYLNCKKLMPSFSLSVNRLAINNKADFSEQLRLILTFSADKLKGFLSHPPIGPNQEYTIGFAMLILSQLPETQASSTLYTSKFITSTFPNERFIAVSILAKNDPKQAVLVLLKSFEEFVFMDKNRKIALEAIMHIRTPESIPSLLIIILTSTDPIKNYIIEQFRHCYHLFPVNCHLVLDSLFSLNPYPKRGIVAELLGRLHNRQYLPILLALMRDRNENHLVRVSTITAIAEINDPSVLQELWTIFNAERMHIGRHSDQEKMVLSALLECIAKLGQLPESLPFEAQISRALGVIASDPHELPSFRSITFAFLWRYHVPDGVDILLETVHEQFTELWQAAAEALRSFPPEIVLPKVLLKITQFHLDETIMSHLQHMLMGINVLKGLELDALTPVQMEFFKTLLLAQGPRNLETLEFLEKRVKNEKVQQELDFIIDQVQPQVRSAEGFTILL